MTYKAFIQNILDTRGRFGIPDGEYKERHHIIPKCMNGSNDKDNLIDLYAKEHFIAHKLLAKENPCNFSLACAWWNMCNIHNKYEDRYITTPREYEEARILFSSKMKMRNMGRNFIHSSRFSNKHHSVESRNKISNSQLGRKLISNGVIQYYIYDGILPSGFYFGSIETVRRLIKFETKNFDSRTGIKKKVCCIELNQIFKSAAEASRILGVSNTKISSCCHGKLNIAGGYHWRFVNE